MPQQDLEEIRETSDGKYVSSLMNTCHAHIVNTHSLLISMESGIRSDRNLYAQLANLRFKHLSAKEYVSYNTHLETVEISTEPQKITV